MRTTTQHWRYTVVINRQWRQGHIVVHANCKYIPSRPGCHWRSIVVALGRYQETGRTFLGARMVKTWYLHEVSAIECYVEWHTQTDSGFTAPWIPLACRVEVSEERRFVRISIRVPLYHYWFSGYRLSPTFRPQLSFSRSVFDWPSHISFAGPTSHNISRLWNRPFRHILGLKMKELRQALPKHLRLLNSPLRWKLSRWVFLPNSSIEIHPDLRSRDSRLLSTVLGARWIKSNGTLIWKDPSSMAHSFLSVGTASTHTFCKSKALIALFPVSDAPKAGSCPSSGIKYPPKRGGTPVTSTKLPTTVWNFLCLFPFFH